VTYTFRCTNEFCENFKIDGFDIEKDINEETDNRCPFCASEVKRVYKKVNVGLRFDGSYNNSRNGGK